jgi:hypothetical protein
MVCRGSRIEDATATGTNKDFESFFEEAWALHLTPYPSFVAMLLGLPEEFSRK